MDLKELISISGKPGLYKVVARSPKSFIVESIDDKKTKFAVNASQQVSLLDEITVYTNSDENIPLKTIFDNISEKNAAGAIPSAKDNPVDIRAFFKDIAPGYDEERVYISDMKKILKWYDLISSASPAETEMHPDEIGTEIHPDKIGREEKTEPVAETETPAES